MEMDTASACSEMDSGMGAGLNEQLPKCYDDLSAMDEAKLMIYLREQERANLIRRSKSEWEFPAATVLKKNGTISLVYDYRKLNKVITKQTTVQPPSNNAAEFARQFLKESKVFFFFDLAFWYRQIPLVGDDACKTAFMTPFGLYEHLRVPFGLAYARETLNNLVQGLLSDLQLHNCRVVCDDFFLYSYNNDEHLRDVAMVMNEVRKRNVTIRPTTMKSRYTMDLYGCQYRYRIKRQKQKKAPQDRRNPLAVGQVES